MLKSCSSSDQLCFTLCLFRLALYLPPSLPLPLFLSLFQVDCRLGPELAGGDGDEASSGKYERRFQAGQMDEVGWAFYLFIFGMKR